MFKKARALIGDQSHVKMFLSTLWSDYRTLFTRDMKSTFTPAPRDQFRSDGAYEIYLRDAKQAHLVTMVRQAVRKQEIRESIVRRTRIAYVFFAPFSMGIHLVIFIIWVVCLAANPSLAHFFLR